MSMSAGCTSRSTYQPTTGTATTPPAIQSKEETQPQQGQRPGIAGQQTAGNPIDANNPGIMPSPSAKPPAGTDINGYNNEAK